MRCLYYSFNKLPSSIEEWNLNKLFKNSKNKVKISNHGKLANVVIKYFFAQKSYLGCLDMWVKLFFEFWVLVERSVPHLRSVNDHFDLCQKWDVAVPRLQRSLYFDLWSKVRNAIDTVRPKSGQIQDLPFKPSFTG